MLMRYGQIYDQTWSDKIWTHIVESITIRYDQMWSDKIWSDMVRSYMVRLDIIRHNQIYHISINLIWTYHDMIRYTRKEKYHFISYVIISYLIISHLTSSQWWYRVQSTEYHHSRRWSSFKLPFCPFPLLCDEVFRISSVYKRRR